MSLHARIWLALGFSASLFAQSLVPARAGLLYWAEGSVIVDGVEAIRSRDAYFIGEGKTAVAAGGHAEILLGPGATLWMQSGSSLRFDHASTSRTRIVLLFGSILIEVRDFMGTRPIELENGSQDLKIEATGLYRLDSEPRRIRVYSGKIPLTEKQELPAGWEMDAPGIRRFQDGPDPEEFHLWAAMRSYTLEREARKLVRWKHTLGGVRHDGFAVTYPAVSNRPDPAVESTEAIHLKYLAMQQAGLLYATSEAFNASSHWPPEHLGKDRLLRLGEGRADVVLAVGVSACIEAESAVRMMDTRPSAPELALEAGTAIIEVKEDDIGRVRIRVGDTVTELRKEGVYEFDAGQRMLWVHRGRSETSFQDAFVTAQKGQHVSLDSPAARGTFKAPRDERFFRWCGDRSFALFRSSAGFMTNWDTAGWGPPAHKVYGSRRTGEFPPDELSQRSPVDISRR
jgi:hypothetical protein